MWFLRLKLLKMSIGINILQHFIHLKLTFVSYFLQEVTLKWFRSLGCLYHDVVCMFASGIVTGLIPLMYLSLRRWPAYFQSHMAE